MRKAEQLIEQLLHETDPTYPEFDPASGVWSVTVDGKQITFDSVEKAHEYYVSNLNAPAPPAGFSGDELTQPNSDVYN